MQHIDMTLVSEFDTFDLLAGGVFLHFVVVDTQLSVLLAFTVTHVFVYG